MKIFDILTAKKAIAILGIFLENSEKEFYQAEIFKKTKLSRTTIIKWLKILEENQFIKKTAGITKFYKLNNENPVAKQVNVLKIVSELYEAIKIIKDEPIEVYLFGSCSRGENTEKSDIDILIIGKSEKIRNFVDLANKITKKEVKPVIKTLLEYSNLARKDKLFYENIEKDKIRLL